jgi:hypothetical protein
MLGDGLGDGLGDESGVGDGELGTGSLRSRRAGKNSSLPLNSAVLLKVRNPFATAEIE